MCCNLQCDIGRFTTKNLGFIGQKCIFEHYREVQTRKILLIDYIFDIEFFSKSPFQSCPLQAYVSIAQRCAVPFKTGVKYIKLFLYITAGLTNKLECLAQTEQNDIGTVFECLFLIQLQGRLQPYPQILDLAGTTPPPPILCPLPLTIKLTRLQCVSLA